MLGARELGSRLGLGLYDWMHQDSAESPKPTDQAVKGGNVEGNRETGSYTNTRESGKTYHGKGDKQRLQDSGKEQAAKNNDPHVATDWKPSASERDVFKDEARRLRGDDNGGPRGHDSEKNYNQRASPGEKYIKTDGH
jgi:hypothetical protein